MNYSRKEVENLLKNYETQADVKPGSVIHCRMADLRKAWKMLTPNAQIVLFWVGVAGQNNGYFDESYGKALTDLHVAMNNAR